MKKDTAPSVTPSGVEGPFTYGWDPAMPDHVCVFHDKGFAILKLTDGKLRQVAAGKGSSRSNAQDNAKQVIQDLTKLMAPPAATAAATPVTLSPAQRRKPAPDGPKEKA